MHGMLKGWWTAVLCGCACTGQGGLVVAYDLITDAAPSTVAPTVAAGALGISNGRILSFATEAAYGSGWGTTATTDGLRYWAFTVNLPEDGMELSSLNMDGWRTATGPAAWAVRWSQDSFAADLMTGALGTDPAVNTVGAAALAASRGGALSGAVEFRLYGYAATSSSGRWYLDRVELNGTALSVPEPGAASLVMVALLWGWTRQRRMGRK